MIKLCPNCKTRMNAEIQTREFPAEKVDKILKTVGMSAKGMECDGVEIKRYSCPKCKYKSKTIIEATVSKEFPF